MEDVCCGLSGQDNLVSKDEFAVAFDLAATDTPSVLSKAAIFTAESSRSCQSSPFACESLSVCCLDPDVCPEVFARTLLEQQPSLGATPECLS